MDYYLTPKALRDSSKDKTQMMVLAVCAVVFLVGGIVLFVQRHIDASALGFALSFVCLYGLPFTIQNRKHRERAQAIAKALFEVKSKRVAYAELVEKFNGNRDVIDATNKYLRRGLLRNIDFDKREKVIVKMV